MGAFPDIFQSLPIYQGDVDTNELKADNCRILFATLPPGSEIAAHTHEEDNYTLVCEGELILEMNGRESSYRCGQWCTVPKGTLHSARTKVLTRVIDFAFSPS